MAIIPFQNVTAAYKFLYKILVLIIRTHNFAFG